VRMVLRVRTKAKKWVVDGAARLLLAFLVLLVCRLSLALSSLQRKSFLDSSVSAAALTHFGAAASTDRKYFEGLCRAAEY
jgi:hypothetical protein